LEFWIVSAGTNQPRIRSGLIGAGDESEKFYLREVVPEDSQDGFDSSPFNTGQVSSALAEEVPIIRLFFA
jgi:hypothetical protein